MREPTPDEVVAARAKIARDLANLGATIDGQLAIALKTITSQAGREALVLARSGVRRLTEIIRAEFEPADATTTTTRVSVPPRDPNGTWRN